MTRLITASGTKALMVIVSKGIAARKMEDEQHTMVTDPHAWHPLPNKKIYVANIRDVLRLDFPTFRDPSLRQPQS
jgi:zinc/manganese transport system substrate-binding protein